MAAIENLSLSKISSIDSLKEFYCDVEPMDNFIHGPLQLSIDHFYCKAYAVKDQESVVAIFALSFDSIDLDSDDKEELQLGISSTETPNVTCEYEDTFYSKRRYPALDIAYLAVNRKYRGKHIGTAIIDLISKMAMEQDFAGCQFLSVEALKKDPWSAVGFYDKCGFAPNELPNPTKDTLRMIKTLKIQKNL